MDYMGNKSYWDDKFIKRSDELFPAEGILVENISYFKTGTVLDIAFGDGRNTMFLLKKAFNVTSIDFSDKALERLNKFCELKGYSVVIRKIDLSDSTALEDIGVFDNILINHYRLSKDILCNIHKNINKDGILFINGFGYKHKVDNRIRKQDLIYTSDFIDIHEYFQLIKCIETEDERGFFSTFIFRRK